MSFDTYNAFPKSVSMDEFSALPITQVFTSPENIIVGVVAVVLKSIVIGKVYAKGIVFVIVFVHSPPQFCLTAKA